MQYRNHRLSGFPTIVKERLPLTHIREAQRMKNESLHLIIERTFS